MVHVHVAFGPLEVVHLIVEDLLVIGILFLPAYLHRRPGLVVVHNRHLVLTLGKLVLFPSLNAFDTLNFGLFWISLRLIRWVCPFVHGTDVVFAPFVQFLLLVQLFFLFYDGQHNGSLSQRYQHVSEVDSFVPDFHQILQLPLAANHVLLLDFYRPVLVPPLSKRLVVQADCYFAYNFDCIIQLFTLVYEFL